MGLKAETGISLENDHTYTGANDGVHGKDHNEHYVSLMSLLNRAINDYLSVALALLANGAPSNKSPLSKSF